MDSNFEVSEEFGSSAGCLRYLIDTYPQDATTTIWLATPSGLVVPHSRPRFLFRGECGQFQETRPNARRAETWTVESKGGERLHLSQRALVEFRGLSAWLLQRFSQPDYDLSASEALAIQQHYGLPTVMLDFTANPGTAMAFAIGGSKKEKDYGRICVLPAESYRNGLMLSELVEHRWALRAHRQEGFGVVALDRPSPDLKSRHAQERWGIRWYEFPITEQDRQISAARYDALISDKDDPTAGILRHHLIEYVENFGKLADDLARWLVNLIPMVPRVYKVGSLSEHGTLVDHVTPNEIGDFDEGRERDQTLRYISTAYPDDSRERVRDWVRLEVGDLLADPRTLHCG